MSWKNKSKNFFKKIIEKFGVNGEMRYLCTRNQVVSANG